MSTFRQFSKNHADWNVLFSPRVTREVPVEGVEATRCMRLEVEHPTKQEVSFDM